MKTALENQDVQERFVLIRFKPDVALSEIENIALKFDIKRFFDEVFYDITLPLSENALARYYSIDLPGGSEEVAKNIIGEYGGLIECISIRKYSAPKGI